MNERPVRSWLSPVSPNPVSLEWPASTAHHIYCLPNDSTLDYTESTGWEEGIQLGEGKGTELSDISHDSLEVSMSMPQFSKPEAGGRATSLPCTPFWLLHVFIGVLSELCSLHFEKEEF